MSAVGQSNYTRQSLYHIVQNIESDFHFLQDYLIGLLISRVTFQIEESKTKVSWHGCQLRHHPRCLSFTIIFRLKVAVLRSVFARVYYLDQQVCTYVVIQSCSNDVRPFYLLQCVLLSGREIISNLNTVCTQVYFQVHIRRFEGSLTAQGTTDFRFSSSSIFLILFISVSFTYSIP